VWNWFAEVNLPNGKKVSECQVLVTAEKACKKRYATDGSTGNLITHLYSKHQIVETTKKSDLMVTINLLNILNLIDKYNNKLLYLGSKYY